MIKTLDKACENDISKCQTRNILNSSPEKSISNDDALNKSINRLFLNSLRSPLAKYWLLDIEKGVVLFFWDDTYQHRAEALPQNSDTLLYGEFFLALNNFTRKAMSQSLQHIRTQRLSLYLIKEKSFLHVFALDRNSPLFMNQLRESSVKSCLLNLSKELSVQWEDIHPTSSVNPLSSAEVIDRFVEHILKIKEQLGCSLGH